jgi:hypothetical protein
VNAVIAEAAVEVHVSLFIVAAKDTGELPVKRDDGTVKDAVRRGDQVAGNDGISIVPPDNVTAAGGSLLPGDIGKGIVRHLRIILYAEYGCRGRLVNRLSRLQAAMKILREILELVKTMLPVASRAVELLVELDRGWTEWDRYSIRRKVDGLPLSFST